MQALGSPTTDLVLLQLAGEHGAESLFVLQLRVHVVDLKVPPGRTQTHSGEVHWE